MAGKRLETEPVRRLFWSMAVPVMLQQMLVQFFKVLLAFVVINAGMKTILQYTLVPIMELGTSVSIGVSSDTIKQLFPTGIEPGEEIKCE